MSPFIHLGNDANGKPIGLDLEILMETGLLIQANSGGGKSYLIRRLAEQAFGKVPVIIIDPEGEFASLREKFGFLLVGEGGDVPADVSSAGLLAESLLRLRASAVCDLHEAFRKNRRGREQWVKNFFEAFNEAPKELWNDTLIITDEVQTFCPQEGDALSTDTMIENCTQGRKRGFCPVWATQRLASVNKAATGARLLNRIIGMTFEDVDMKRAVELLSVESSEKLKFRESLRTLPQGDFFGFGRAIATTRTRFHGGLCQTTHPKRGSRRDAGPPPTPAAIVALLPQLRDLPAQAEEKAHTERELRAQIDRLEDALTAEKRNMLQKDDPRIQEWLIRAKEDGEMPFRRIAADVLAAVQEFRNDSDHAFGKMIERLSVLPSIEHNEFVNAEAGGSRSGMADVRSSCSERLTPAEYAGGSPLTTGGRLAVAAAPSAGGHPIRDGRNGGERGQVGVHSAAPVSNGTLPEGERDVLTAIAQFRGGVDSNQLAVLTGYKASTRRAYIARLRGKSLIDKQDKRVTITAEGLKALGPDFRPLPTGRALRDHWKSELPAGEREIFQILIETYPSPVEFAAINERCGFAASTRRAYIARMNAKRLIERVGGSSVRAAKELF